jgi:hypothetical protein
MLANAKHTYPKGDDRIAQATRTFHKVCLKRRSEFASETPDMLKYEPKRFWGMLCNKQSTVGVSAQAFAQFNEQLYYDSQIPEDKFQLPEDLENAKITPEELKQVLDMHYPANKSIGLSNMPMQCVKWIGEKALPTIADFLNKSAINELAPQQWRTCKVVPLYKGEGDINDSNNYRSIAVSPPLAKLFMSIIN